MNKGIIELFYLRVKGKIISAHSSWFTVQGYTDKKIKDRPAIEL